MLQMLKKLGKLNKKFYGMNMGTYGFLMNKFESKKFIENIAKSKLVNISALQMIAKNKNNIVICSFGNFSSNYLSTNIFR